MKALSSSMYFFPFKLIVLLLLTSSIGTAAIRITEQYYWRDEGIHPSCEYIHHVMFRHTKLMASKSKTTSLVTVVV